MDETTSGSGENKPKYSIITFISLALTIIFLVISIIYQYGNSGVSQVINAAEGRMYYTLKGYSGALAFCFVISFSVTAATAARMMKNAALGIIVATISPQLYIIVWSLSHGMGKPPLNALISLEIFRGTQNYDSFFARAMHDMGVPWKIAESLDLTNPSALLTSVILGCAVLLYLKLKGTADEAVNQ